MAFNPLQKQPLSLSLSNSPKTSSQRLPNLLQNQPFSSFVQHFLFHYPIRQKPPSQQLSNLLQKIKINHFLSYYPTFSPSFSPLQKTSLPKHFSSSKSPFSLHYSFYKKHNSAPVTFSLFKKLKTSKSSRLPLDYPIYQKQLS